MLKSLKRVVLSASLTLILLFVGAATASAGEITYIGTNPDGSTIRVSFGSSAGYYVMKCPEEGGPRIDVTPSGNTQ